MSRHGICTTCIRAEGCTLTSNGAVWECEEFEPGPPAPPAVQVPRAQLQSSSVVLGLCSNCGHREECTFDRPEGGVWHCEEYE